MKSLLKGRILLLIIFVMGAGILYYAYINVGYISRINSLQSELAEERKKRTELEKKLEVTEENSLKELDMLREKLAESERRLVALPQLQEFEIEQLKEKGLQNPIEDIKQDLINRKDLIPYKGILGGTMGFYYEGIHVISTEWVAAYFEDGHINGIMLLRYNVLKDGKIRWSVIDSYMY
jgi:hypothetical protein